MDTKKDDAALNIKIDGIMKRSLKVMAAKQGRTLRDIVEAALSEYLVKHKIEEVK